MSLKDFLESLWNKVIFNPSHINLWTYEKGGSWVGLTDEFKEVWVRKGRRVK